MLTQITDCEGVVKYKAKSEGLPKLPEMGLYDANGNKLGYVTKEMRGNPVYTLYYKDKKIATVHQRISIKPKYDIPENGWSFESGISRTTVYDENGAVAVQSQYMLSSSKGSVIVEYTNKENEIPALLITLSMIIAFHL